MCHICFLYNTSHHIYFLKIFIKEMCNINKLEPNQSCYNKRHIKNSVRMAQSETFINPLNTELNLICQ